MEVDELIKKLETVVVGNRELDAAIHVYLNPGRMTHPKLPVGYTMNKLEGRRANSLAASKFISRARGPSPNYTTSLDVGLTKMLPLRWHVDCLFTGDLGTRESNLARYPSCRLKPDLDNDEGWRVGVIDCKRAATPALALCSASLKVLTNLKVLRGLALATEGYIGGRHD